MSLSVTSDYREVRWSWGFDAYLTTKAFSGHEWTLKEDPDGNKKRNVSSKTLADVIEALLGAAHMDSFSGDAGNEDKVLRTLSLFLPEVAWKSPSQEISQLPNSKGQALLNSERLFHGEHLLGYSFRNRLHLAEALTHSTVQTGVHSYERLEFLGDAVIDVIVKEHLFKSRHDFSEGEMHTRHIALVNKDIFAYLATRNAVEVEEKVVTTNLRTREPEVSTKVRRRCLHDFVVKVSSEEHGDLKKDFMGEIRDGERRN